MSSGPVQSSFLILGEQIRFVNHCLELKVVPAGILEEHRPLLPGSTLEPPVRLYNELHLLALKTLRKLMKLVQF